MNISKAINVARRTVMRTVTGHLGTSRMDANSKLERDQIKSVLICRPNHRLGNLLLTTPVVQEVMETFPHAKIDLFVKGNVAPTLFKNYRNINRIIQLPKKPLKNILRYLSGWMTIQRSRYDIVINVVKHSSSGKIAARLANARYEIHGDIDEAVRSRYNDHEQIAKYPVYTFRHCMISSGLKFSEKEVPSLDLKLDAAEIAKGKEVLNGLVDGKKRTIGIYTYATGAKCYDIEWWEEFYGGLKVKFSQFNILEILPVENVSQISFRAPSYYSRDLRQIASVIANTDVFVGADSGMMHLASASRTPVVGLFKAKNINTYAPYNNKSLGINTNEASLDDCMKIIGRILEVR